MTAFSGILLCPKLKSDEHCIRVRQYKAGTFIELHHEHHKLHELAQQRMTSLLWSLVLRHEEATAAQIVQAHLTRRGKAARYSHPLHVHFEYPEPAVVRRTCGGNTIAMIDTVTNPDTFRK